MSVEGRLVDGMQTYFGRLQAMTEDYRILSDKGSQILPRDIDLRYESPPVKGRPI